MTAMAHIITNDASGLGDPEIVIMSHDVPSRVVARHAFACPVDAAEEVIANLSIDIRWRATGEPVHVEPGYVIVPVEQVEDAPEPDLRAVDENGDWWTCPIHLGAITQDCQCDPGIIDHATARAEWGVVWPSGRPGWPRQPYQRADDQAHARRLVKEFPDQARLVRRVVQTTPWEPEYSDWTVADDISY